MHYRSVCLMLIVGYGADNSMIDMHHTTTHSGASCSFKCNKADSGFLDAWKTQLTTMAKIDDDVISDMTDQATMDIADEVICDKSFWPGDHLEAASPVEASFWPIHPTVSCTMYPGPLSNALPCRQLSCTKISSNDCFSTR